MKKSEPIRRTIGNTLAVPATAARFMNHIQRTWYVSDLPEFRDDKQHGDFGYTDVWEKAIPLSPYWQRRFRVQVRNYSEFDCVAFSEVG